MRLLSVLLVALLGLSACAPNAPTLGTDGKPLPQVYRIGRADESKIMFRMLDSVNALRGVANLQPVALDPKLNAAAATHALDMSAQNRPWLFGSDGSSPIDRIERVGYTGTLLGQVISESYETELETLAAWMEKPDSRRVILVPGAVNMGFAWHQESNGKIWWSLILAE